MHDRSQPKEADMPDPGKALVPKRWIKNELTQYKRLELGDIIAKTIEGRDKAEEIMKQQTKSAKQIIETHDREIREAARMLAQGFEMIEVPIKITRHLENNTIKIERTDTGELVEERAMTSAERAQLMREAE